MSKFKVGDRVVRINTPQTDMPVGGVFLVTDVWGDQIQFTDLKGDRRTRSDLENFALTKKKASQPTKEQRAIARAEADLQALKDKAAKKAKTAVERKAKAERAKVMRGLSPAGKRVVDVLRQKPDAFGCQREAAVLLVAALTGDDHVRITRALA